MSDPKMDTKVTLSYGLFNLVLEGREAFVEAQLNMWAGKIPSIASASFQPVVEASSGSTSEVETAIPATGDEPVKKTRKTSKSGGPSCASRIRALIDEGFFSAPKKAADVSEKLKEKATPYEGKHVAAALISTVQSGKLRRVSEGGLWAYVNP